MNDLTQSTHKIEIYDDSMYEQICSILSSHGKIAKRKLDENFDFEKFKIKISSPSVYSVVALNDFNEVDSFMVSKKIPGLPTWCVKLILARKSNSFNPVNNGICALYDATIQYWESNGLTNFVYSQPTVFLKGPNLLTRQGSSFLQTYTPYDICIVEANKKCEHELLESVLFDGKIFPSNMIVRWLFKNEK